MQIILHRSAAFGVNEGGFYLIEVMSLNNSLS
jgi:hypothetical protein